MPFLSSSSPCWWMVTIGQGLFRLAAQTSRLGPRTVPKRACNLAGRGLLFGDRSRNPAASRNPAETRRAIFELPESCEDLILIMK